MIYFTGATRFSKSGNSDCDCWSDTENLAPSYAPSYVHFFTVLTQQLVKMGHGLTFKWRLNGFIFSKRVYCVHRNDRQWKKIIQKWAGLKESPLQAQGGREFLRVTLCPTCKRKAFASEGASRG